MAAIVIFIGGLFAGDVKQNFNLSASTSPDFSSPYISYGDVDFWAQRDGELTQATTTVCALQAPASTSTLTFAGIQLTTSSTTASVMTIAKAATPYATTTWLTNESIDADAQASIVVPATTTPAGMAKFLFAPNEYVVFAMSGGAGTFSPAGACQATWIQL